MKEELRKMIDAPPVLPDYFLNKYNDPIKWFEAS